MQLGKAGHVAVVEAERVSQVDGGLHPVRNPGEEGVGVAPCQAGGHPRGTKHLDGVLWVPPLRLQPSQLQSVLSCTVQWNLECTFICVCNCRSQYNWMKECCRCYGSLHPVEKDSVQRASDK